MLILSLIAGISKFPVSTGPTLLQWGDGIFILSDPQDSFVTPTHLPPNCCYWSFHTLVGSPISQISGHSHIHALFCVTHS